MGSMNDADRLREFLEKAELSQRGAARAIEIDERTMRRYCAGELPVPKVVWLALETVKRKKGRI
jgi:plasmid maintenance system antidote protein VapI